MLPDFITESERFATMEGNVGRKVTRYLEQIFAGGNFSCSFSCEDATDIVDKAFFVMRMQECIKTHDLAAHKIFDLDMTANVDGIVTLTVTPQITPVTVCEKQDLLDKFSYMMRRFVVFAYFTTREVLDKMHKEHFEREPFTKKNINYTYLNELVGGNYENLSRTAGNVLTLAVALNPTVREKYRTC